MPDVARTPRQAFQRYRRYLQLPLACLSTTAQWHAKLVSNGSDLSAMILRPGALRLVTEDGTKLYLSAAQLFTIGPHPAPERAGEFKVRTEQYIYALACDEQLKEELVAWHWHPEVRTEPHLHARVHEERFAGLGKLHLPTSRVSFESIVRFAVEDLRAQPAREDWREQLEDTEGRFREHRSWSDRPASDDD